MTVNVAINGFGRIGRNVMRALWESGRQEEVRIVAINDMCPVETLAHLLRYDSVHGHFGQDVVIEGDGLRIGGQEVRVCCERDPAQLPWADLHVDVVFECTGFFASKEKSMAHIQAGAKKVLISAPAGTDVDATIVYGVNHKDLTAGHQVVSNASCTTNCLAPIVKPLHEAIGIETGLMTTIHAYTNDQGLTDAPHKDLRRARAATQSMIPTKTGAAAAIGLVIPDLAGKLDGFAMRVPTINVSVVDLTFQAKRDTTVEEVNALLTSAAAGPLGHVLAINEAPLVSIDFNHNPASSIADITQTRVLGRCVKVLSWYDNEWGFSNRMIDTCLAMMAA